MRSILKSAMLAAGAAALAATLAIPASADPAGNGNASDIVLVGSDTIEYLMDQGPLGTVQNLTTTPVTPGEGVGTLYNGQTPAPSRLVADYYATPAGNITVKGGAAPCANIPRPNGSSAGIAALDNATYGSCFDIARSSRGRDNAGHPGDATKLFIPFAQDELKYAKAVNSTVPDGLTKANLASIYTTAGCGGYHPLIPQAGSGTRTLFEARLGITDAQLATCVGTMQEHDPALIQNDTIALAPFSVARFTYPVSRASVITLNTTGLDEFRAVYLVVRDAGGFTVPQPLQALVGDGTAIGGGGFMCTPAVQGTGTPPAGGELQRQGFTQLDGRTPTPSQCGVAE